MEQIDRPDFDDLAKKMDTPDLLMEATVWVLAEEGYHGLTLRKVAEISGKNRGLVHYYFDSKADLMASLIEHIREGTRRLIGLEETDSPEEKLWTALRFHTYGPGGLDEAGRHYYLAILQLQALAAHEPSVREYMSEYQGYIVDTLYEIIQEGIERGAFQTDDPYVTATVFSTAIVGARTVDLSTNADTCREFVIAFLDQFISSQLKH